MAAHAERRIVSLDPSMVSQGRRIGGTPARWLCPIEFGYAPLGRGRAAVGLVASVAGQSIAPARPTLVVRGAGLRSEHPALAERVEERMESGLLWVVVFELPLEIVRGPRAWFTLNALERMPVPLPAPLVNPRVVEALGALQDRPNDRWARRCLVALGAGVAVATATAVGASAAAASPPPVVKVAPAPHGQAGSPAPPVPTKQPNATKKPATPAPSPKAAPHKSKVIAKPPRRTVTSTPAHAPAHKNTKHTTSLGTALKITRPDSAEVCQRILLLPESERKAALKRAHLPAKDCESTTHPKATKKQKKHRKHHKRKQHAAHRVQHAAHRHKPAALAHKPAAHAHKPAAPTHVNHPSGGAGLSTPRPRKPHIAPRQPHIAAPITTPAAAVNPAPQATTIWNGGFNIDPFTAKQLQQFSTLSANLDQPPRFLIPIYKAAGRRFHVPWQILAAINAIETNYGQNLSVSPAGAIGWMQFMPETWMRYGIAASAGSRPNPYDPRDAIFSAARYLDANGGAEHIRNALFAYNHAWWYVDAVLWRSQLITDQALGKHAGKNGYALPLDLRYMDQLGRTDDGVDIEDAPDGVAVYSITPGVVTAVASDPSGFGPNYPVVLVTQGPLAGQYVYYGHVAASLVHVGQQVLAGQPIAVIGHTGDAASLGHGHIEIGFSDASGDPLNHHGLTAWTPSGDAMRRVLMALTDAFRLRPSETHHKVVERPSSAIRYVLAMVASVVRSTPL